MVVVNGIHRVRDRLLLGGAELRHTVLVPQDEQARHGGRGEYDAQAQDASEAELVEDVQVRGPLVGEDVDADQCRGEGEGRRDSDPDASDE